MNNFKNTDEAQTQTWAGGFQNNPLTVIQALKQDRQKNIIYLSGKMTGEVDYGFPVFDKYAELWRKAGYVISSPAENFGKAHGLDRNQYLKIDYLNLINSCSGIAMIPGWEASEGARTELAIAQSLGYEVYDATRPGVRLKLGAVAPDPIKTAEAVAVMVEKFIQANQEQQAYRDMDKDTDEGTEYESGPCCGNPDSCEQKCIHNDSEKEKDRKELIDWLVAQPACSRESLLALGADGGFNYQEQVEAKADKQKSICEIADQLVSVERQKSYGSPKDDFARTVGMANAIGFRFQDPKVGLRKLEPKDHPIYLLLTKLSREAHSHKRDNLIDGAGYFKTLDQIHDGKD